ncbi:hypothetical protein KAR91_28525 [Candidatus Pacearchaeota archaeon]|nr:hypothetical protein [Candidatus Pacearchaeota archaeon]
MTQDGEKKRKEEITNGGERLKKKQWKPTKKFKENLQKLFSDGKVTVRADVSNDIIAINTEHYKLNIVCKNGLEVEEI